MHSYGITLYAHKTKRISSNLALPLVFTSKVLCDSLIRHMIHTVLAGGTVPATVFFSRTCEAELHHRCSTVLVHTRSPAPHCKAGVARIVLDLRW